MKFSFLPVHRLSLIIDIPSNDINIESCSSNNQCINGKCIKYLNNKENRTFCQCNKGWSGRYCTIQHSSLCLSDSLYIGISPNNRSICVCPINKFGPRCLLNNMICQNDENLDVKMVVNVFQLMNIKYLIKNLFVFVEKVILEIDVK
jgi:hypothetical protein